MNNDNNDMFGQTLNQDIYSNQQNGYQNQQGMYPNQQMGYQNQQGMHPNQQMGYQNQQEMPFNDFMNNGNIQVPNNDFNMEVVSEYKKRLRGMKEVQDLTGEVEIQNPNSIVMFGQRLVRIYLRFLMNY